MKRTALVVSITATIIASVMVAHAATLQVNSGVLQTQSIVADIDIPDHPVTSYTISVTGWRSPSGQTTTVSATVAANGSYRIGFVGTGTVVTCSSVGHTIPSGQTEQGPGEYEATGDAHFRFCVRQGTETPTIAPVEDGGGAS